MTVAGAAACAVLGVLVGFFLNVVIERVPEKQPLRPLRQPQRSSSLPLWAVLVPPATGVLFAAVWVRFEADWAVPAYLALFAALLAISVIDLQRQIIPNRIVYPAIFVSIPLLAVAAWAENDWSRLGRALLGASLAWLALLLVHLVSPGGMGFGDVRLSFLLGLFLGWLGLGYVLVGMFLGFLLGALIGGVLVLFRIRDRNDHVPFGPFLAAGAAVAVFVGEPMVKAWLGT